MIKKDRRGEEGGGKGKRGNERERDNALDLAEMVHNLTTIIFTLLQI